MTEKLFREAAVNHHRENIYGNVLLTTPMKFKLMTLFFLMIASMVTMFLFFGQYARKESVRGQLVPNQGIVRVLAASRGTIKQTHVTNGEQVHAGDVLFTINTETYTHNNQVLNDEIKQELLIRLENTQEKINNTGYLFINEMTRYKSKVKAIETDLLKIREQQAGAYKLVNISKKQLHEHEKYFARQLVLEADVENKKIAYLNAKLSYEEIQRLILNKESELAEFNRKQESLPQENQNRLLDLQDALSQTKQSLAEIQGAKAHIIRAPINGVVATIVVNAGQTVSADSSLLTILPNDFTLHAELFLPSRSIGFVEKDKQVLLRYDAFPYQRYGLYEGRISEVGATTLATNTITPFNSSEPVYKVKVKLEQQTINAYGKKIALQPGMLVTAGIILENRSMIEWLLEPILSLRGAL